MSQRKPQDEDWEHFVDAQIREAMNRGGFSGLPGTGKPIPGIEKPHDELWWVKDKLKRENLPGLLPEAIEVRRDLEKAVESAARARSEDELRRILTALNVRIRKLNATTTSGPPTTVAPIDVDEMIRRWRRSRRKGR